MFFNRQAAGVLVIAHRSGGPEKDIVVPFEGQRTGTEVVSCVNPRIAHSFSWHVFFFFLLDFQAGWLILLPNMRMPCGRHYR
jgi:hypothetical protein